MSEMNDSLFRHVTNAEAAAALFGAGLSATVCAALSGHFVRAVVAGAATVGAAHAYRAGVEKGGGPAAKLYDVAALFGDQMDTDVSDGGLVGMSAAEREEVRACEE